MPDYSNFKPRPQPGLTVLTGHNIRLEPLNPARHSDGLGLCAAGPQNAALWQYMPRGPFENAADLMATLSEWKAHSGWETLVFVAPGDGTVLGMASFMRIRRDHGSAEIGCVVFGNKLQRTKAATEAMYLMAKHIFDDLGYRRYEWKCHNENEASKRAALRLGFAFEGVFRNDMVMKGKNRDTAWYSIIDTEWPAVKAGLEAWLSPENFDPSGNQIKPLCACRTA